MTYPVLPLFTSIDAIRPVFMIVMGIFLMIIAWRLANTTTGWTARLMIAGALLLGFGYAVLLPLYEAGGIEKLSRSGPQNSEATAVAWHCVRIFVMNAGWLAFGLGLALYAKIFSPSAVSRRELSTAQLSPHESAH